MRMVCCWRASSVVGKRDMQICHFCTHSLRISGWVTDMSCSSLRRPLQYSNAYSVAMGSPLATLMNWPVPLPNTASIRCWPRVCYIQFALLLWRDRTLYRSRWYHATLVSRAKQLSQLLMLFLSLTGITLWRCVVFLQWFMYALQSLNIPLLQYHGRIIV